MSKRDLVMWGDRSCKGAKFMRVLDCATRNGAKLKRVRNEITQRHKVDVRIDRGAKFMRVLDREDAPS
ncbi:MAG: hypothetical protein IPO69_02720 [Saprospiraceae bacterium]|nr:hypothetical protein [Saprospiraceae bacterium]